MFETNKRGPCKLPSEINHFSKKINCDLYSVPSNLHQHFLKLLLPIILIPIILSPSIDSERLYSGRASAQYRTATACENSILEIVCEKDTQINLIRANFGRFSIQTCNEHGSQEMRIDCVSPISFRVMEESCGMKQSCVIAATSTYFGDHCPGTPKYLEAHYQCLPGNQKKRSRGQSTTPRTKILARPSLSSPVTPTTTTTTTTTMVTPSTVYSSLPGLIVNGPIKPAYNNGSVKNDLTHPDLVPIRATNPSAPTSNSQINITQSVDSAGLSNSSRQASAVSVDHLKPINVSTTLSTSIISTLSTLSSTTTAPQTPLVKIDSDFEDKPIYIKHPHPGATLTSNESSKKLTEFKSNEKSNSMSELHPKLNSALSESSSSDSKNDKGESSNTYESSSLNLSSGKFEPISNNDQDFDETAIFLRHPHPGVTGTPSSSNPGEWPVRYGPINGTSKRPTESWWSLGLSRVNLIIAVIFAVCAFLLGLLVFFGLYLRDTNIKSRFLSLASALNGKIICSRNIRPMEPGATIKSDSASLRKRGGHLISVTPTSKYMSSENAAHYIRDPIIGPNSGSTLNVITPLGVKFLLPPGASASVKDLTYGCSQLLGSSGGNNSLTLHQPGSAGHHHHHHHHLQHHVQSLRSPGNGLALPLGLFVEHVYECIDDDPYTAKLFMPVNECLDSEAKYQRRDNSIYNGGDFLPPTGVSSIANPLNQHHSVHRSLPGAHDLTTIQALPAIVQENSNHRIASTLDHHQSGQMSGPNTVTSNNSNNPLSGLNLSTNYNPNNSHYQLNYTCYPCQSQVANYINKDRIDQQLREGLTSDVRRPEIV